MQQFIDDLSISGCVATEAKSAAVALGYYRRIWRFEIHHWAHAL